MDTVTIYIGLILLLNIIFTGSILVVLAHALKKTGRSLKPVFVAGSIILLWLIGITFLNFSTGVYTKELILGIGIPVLLGVLLLQWKPYRVVIKAIPQANYMKLQALRIFFGIVFLVEVFIGELPSWFRNLAGGGDIAAGIAGLLAFFLITRFGVIKWRVITANIIGILDFLSVLPLGILIIVVDVPVGLTIILIPMFAVPLFILQHIYSLTYLKTQQSG
ncbi:MAG: hypothetical protein ACC651_07570 [Candidatus Scalindua sp.]